MGRGRIAMELIQKEKARKTTFQKRKNGLMKKAHEFSTLCGVDVCVITFAPEFDGQGLAEPETWPQESTEVHRIIQKFHNTTADRRPKIYDVEEYYKDRIKKIEADIFKVRKENLKISYPTWDDSFNALGGEQLRIFVSMLDVKLDACNQRMNMLKGDPKGKATAESDKVETSNPSSHLNLIQNMSQTLLFPLLMKPISDNIQLPFQFSQSSQSSMLNCTPLMGINGMVDWADQVGATVSYDPKTITDGAENNDNGNTETMQSPGTVALQTLHSHSPYPPRFQLNGFYDPNVLQAQEFTYTRGRK